jgi:hypothetical protein
MRADWLLVVSIVGAQLSCGSSGSDESEAEGDGGCSIYADPGGGEIDSPECQAALDGVYASCDSRERDGICRDYPMNGVGCLDEYSQSELCDRGEELGFCIQVGTSTADDDWWLQHFYPDPEKDDCEATRMAASLCTISPARTWCNTKFAAE